jgi:hypothetical protein
MQMGARIDNVERGWRAGLAAALALVVLVPVWADDQPAAATKPATSDAGSENAMPREQVRPLRGYSYSRWLMEPQPVDKAALDADELEDLLAFVEERIPRLHRRLAMMRRREPERFAERFAQHAPRLRHLRRVFAEVPAAGELMVEHMQNKFRAGGAARRLKRLPEESLRYEFATRKVRERLAENVRVEERVLITIAEHIAAHVDALAERRVDYLLDPDTDLAALPERARRHIQAYHASADPVERREMRRRMLQRAADLLGAEERTLLRRAADVRDHAVALVDERLEELKQQAQDEEHHRHRGRRRR